MSALLVESFVDTCIYSEYVSQMAFLLVYCTSIHFVYAWPAVHFIHKLVGLGLYPTKVKKNKTLVPGLKEKHLLLNINICDRNGYQNI